MGHWRRVWVGATTQRAPARKEEQHPQACCQWLNRVRSAVTQRVNAIEAEKVNAHKDLQMETSGQPRNVGSRLATTRVEQVALTTHGANKGRGGRVGFNLAAQACHPVVDAAVKRVALVAAQHVHQRVAR